MKRPFFFLLLVAASLALSAQSADKVTVTANGVSFDMIFVQGGEFTMGCTGEQGADCTEDEKPAHSVTLSDFYIGETEVTQALWNAVMGSNPSAFKGDDFPVEQVNLFQAMEFVDKLNEITGKTFRIPTEAEWEYAARGGQKSQHHKYSGSNTLSEVGWSKENSGAKTHPVKSKAPNELGLYDMSGNVWEWCSDVFGRYGAGAVTNPGRPMKEGLTGIRRGGCWMFSAAYNRVATRSRTAPERKSNQNGFRLVLVP